MSPVAISDGILGLEAYHRWAGGVLLNTRAAPRWRLTKITGLHSAPEADDNRAPRTARRGEQLYPSHARGRTIVYEGVLEARTLQQTRQLAHILRAATQDRWREFPMSVEPDPAYGGVSHFYFARVIGLDIDDEQTNSAQSTYPYARNFQLTLRQSDARYYVTGLQEQQGAAGQQVHCHNVGTAPADPVILCHGPFSGNVVLSRGDGPSLTFSEVTIPSGTSLRVEFGPRRASIVSTGQDRTGTLDLSVSSWWDEGQDGLRAGVDEGVTVFGTPYTVQWHHAQA